MKGLKGRSLAIIAAVLGLLLATASSAAASPVTYHGGAVVRSPQVRVIFWGSNWNSNPGAREKIQGLFGSLSGSNYQGILTQYYDTGGNISANVGFDSWTDQSIAAPNNVNWTNIENEIQYSMAQRGWAGGINNVYIVLPAPGSKYQAGFQLGCASHYYASSVGSPMAYVGWPGDESFSACTSYDPGKQHRAWAAASVAASHEYAEAVTDPITKKYLGTFNGVGWITEEKEDEVADKCVYLGGGMANGFYVDYLWDNSVEGCSLSHPPQNPPPPPPPSEQFIAFEANTGSMLTYSSILKSAWDTKSGMAAGTSPSVAFVPGVGYLVAFQNWKKELWLYFPNGTWYNTGLGMAANTSPSIAAKPDGSYIVAFQANTGEMLYWSSTLGAGYATKMGMMKETSPSAVYVPSSNSFVVAFQDWQQHLWTYSTATGNGVNTTLGMALNTSPSIALKSDGNYVVAIQAVETSLWTYTAASGGVKRNLGMKAKTSPSVAAGPGGSYIAAFQANTGALWYYSTDLGGGYNTGGGMAADTSPSAGYLPDLGGYSISFQDWQTHLWTYETLGGGSWVNTNLGMAGGTSPSMTVH